EAAHKFRDLILVWPRMLSLGPPPPPLTPPPCRERGTRTRARCWYAGFWLPSLVGGRCARRRRSQASECASSARSAGVPTGGSGPTTSPQAVSGGESRNIVVVGAVATDPDRAIAPQRHPKGNALRGGQRIERVEVIAGLIVYDRVRARAGKPDRAVAGRHQAIENAGVALSAALYAPS